MKFEYLHINITAIDTKKCQKMKHDGLDRSWYEKFLNDYGKKGWELCAVDDIYYFFKRELK